MNKFTVKNKDGQDIELEFCEPKSNDLIEAGKVYSKTFADMLSSGGLLRKKLAEYLKTQNLWDDNKQKELDKIQKSIVEKEHKLHVGNIKLSEAKKIALAMREDRKRQGELLSSYNEYDNMTVEGQADNARFNYMVYACTVYSDSKKRYFDNYESFIAYNDSVAFIAASRYANEYYGLAENFESSLPENKFLKEQKFVNDDLRLINKDGNLVDEKGNLVNESGFKIDVDGNILDNFGFKRSKTGEFIDKPKPFLDDNGNPIVADSKTENNSVEDSA